MYIPNRIFIPAAAAILLSVSFALGVAVPSYPPDYNSISVLNQATKSNVKMARSTALKDIYRDEPGPNISAKAAILIDVSTRTILYSKEPNLRRAPASTTKILTALVALEKGDLNNIVTVSSKAAAVPGSSLNLRTGERLRMNDLLTGLLMRSGNDAAVAIAEHISGDTASFARLMNSRAVKAGAGKSNFVNPHGLDTPNHYTTAHDLALITLEAIENPTFAKIVRTRTEDIGTYPVWQKEINNTNRLLWSFDGAEGVKTGTTSRAGNCLVSLASRRGRQLLAVVLGARDRWWDSKLLLSYGFDNFTLVTGSEEGEIVDNIEIEQGMKKTITLVAANTQQFAIRNSDMEKLELHMAIPSPIKAPVLTGQTIGSLIASVDGIELARIPLRVKSGVVKRTWWRLLYEWLGTWLNDIAKMVTGR